MSSQIPGLDEGRQIFVEESCDLLRQMEQALIGMPAEAIKLGAAERVMSLSDLPAAILAAG